MGISTLMLWFAVAASPAPMGCGPLGKAGWNGPFDYTDPTERKMLAPVERHHFRENTQLLQPEPGGKPPGTNLDFVLRWYPNHYPALNLMARLAEKEHTDHPAGTMYPAECYFKRAIQFRPKDPALHLLYGNFLVQQDRLKDAEAEYLKSEELNPENPELDYNLGLLYVKMKKYPEAVKRAKKAYAGGMTFPGLREQLKESGHWTESESK